MKTFRAALLFALATAMPSGALVTATRNGANLATRNYPSSSASLIPVTVTLAGEAGFTITATLDGAPLAMGATLVQESGYHEIHETRVNAETGVSSTALAFQFIIAAPGRGSTEMGLPISQPWPLVNDAPSAFAGQELSVIAPAKYPLHLPLPMALRLKKGASAGEAAGDPLFLNGVASLGGVGAGDSARSVQLKRGWGSTILPPAGTAGSVNLDAAAQGLHRPLAVEYEAETAWISKSGNVSGTVAWPENSRVFLSGRLTVKSGAILTVGPGSVLRAAPGAEIWVEAGGGVRMEGTLSAPIVVVPDNPAAPWGGVWLHQSPTEADAASFVATATLFCCWGADQDWYNASGVSPSRSIFSRHRQVQPCFAIGNHALCSLKDCSLVGPVTPGQTRGAAFALEEGRLRFEDSSAQRAITGGEQVGGSVEIHRSALFEMTEPNTSADDGAVFDDADNDGIYLVPGDGNTYHISKTFIGYLKDDGIDSGADGPGSVLVEGSWFENCTHEAFSNSGGNRVPEMRGSVCLNNGQGMECGYGDSGTGPRSLVEGCLLAGNLAGARYGDSYSSMGTYGGSITVRNSFLLYNRFRDAFAMEWRASSNWAYQDSRLILQNTKVTRAADLAHQQGPEDTPPGALWDPESDGPGIAAFMPVPDSKVGVAILRSERLEPLSGYPGDGVFQVRLSTFSSRTVTVPWTVTGKTDRYSPAEMVIASGTLTFPPGESLQVIRAPLPELASLDLARISLEEPLNAENTGEDHWFLKIPPAVTETPVAKASPGWDYYANRLPAANAQQPANDAAGRAWTAADFEPDANWKRGKTAPLGWGNLGSSPYLSLGSTLPSSEQGISTYFRRTFELTDPSRIQSLQLRLLYDDGAAVFLNGTAFPSQNLETGGASGIASDKLAFSTRDGAGETTYQSLDAGAGVLAALRPGRNVLAVEIHQSSASSGDAVCDAELILTEKPPGGGTLRSFPLQNHPYLFWDNPAGRLEQSLNLQDWEPLPGAPNPFRIPVEGTRKFYRVRN